VQTASHGKNRKSHHFSHVYASFWRGMEQRFNRRQNLTPDETDKLDLHERRAGNRRQKYRVDA